MTADMDARAQEFESVAVPAAARSLDRFAGIAALAGFALTILTFYPGFMTSDSVGQFEQGVRFSFDDWHPPIMSFVWSLLDVFRSGPEPMLIMQAGLYWGGVYFLLTAIQTRSTAVRWIVAALLFSPALLNFAGVIWVDVQLAAAWSFVIGCTFALRAKGAKPRWPVKALLIAILTYGALVRYNSALVAGPLLLYVLTGNAVARRLWITAALYLIVAIGTLATGQVVNRLLRAQHTPIVDALYVFDLAGVSVDSSRNAFPIPLTPAEMGAVKTCYAGRFVNPYIWGDCGFVWNELHSPVNRPLIQRSWISAITHNIPDYLEHRFSYFGQFLDLTTPRASPYIFQEGTTPNNYGFKTRYHGLYHMMLKYIKIFSNTIIFRPVTWLILSLCIATFAVRRDLPEHDRGFLLAASLSGAAYLLTYLPFGVAQDFRYAYLSIAMTTFALCVLAPRAVAFGAHRLASVHFPRGRPVRSVEKI